MILTGQDMAPLLEVSGIPCFSHMQDKYNNFVFNVEDWHVPQTVAAQMKQVNAAIQLYGPDLLVGQQLTLGPILSAEKYHLPLTIMGMATYLFPSSSNDTADAARLWRFRSIMEHLNGARNLLGMTPIIPDLDANPLVGDLYLLRTVPALESNMDLLPNFVHCVGGCLWEPNTVDEGLRRWKKTNTESEKSILYVQPGRDFSEPNFLNLLLDAADQLDIRLAVTSERMDEPPTITKNHYLNSHIGMNQILPVSQAVISNGHTTSVLGAIMYGLPQMLFPNGSGTGDIARNCEASGIGTVINLNLITRDELVRQLNNLLTNTELRHRSEQMRSHFADYSGFSVAATLIEKLGTTGTVPIRS